MGKNEYKSGNGREGMTFAELRNLVEQAYRDGAKPDQVVKVTNGFKGQLLSFKVETNAVRAGAVRDGFDVDTNSYFTRVTDPRDPRLNGNDVLGDWHGRNEFGA